MCLVFLCFVPIKAQEILVSDPAESEDSVITEKFAIYYRFDNTDFDESYLTNRESAEHIRNYLNNSPRIDSITIYSWASPEGAYDHNVWLSKERANTAKRFLLSNSPDSLKLDSGKIHISPLAENWPGLLTLVEENYNRHDREKVIAILKNASIGDETRKWRLKQLDNGYTWNYLWRNYMPQLRAATWVCVWAEVIDPLPEVAQVNETLQYDSGIAPADVPVSVQPVRRMIAALKTNLLYDAVTAVNAELEIPIGDKWSVAVEDVFPWWTWGPNKNKYAFQFWEIGVEPRWWFRRSDANEKLLGHFLGAYAYSGRYDFQNNTDICYQGEGWSAGLSYGYAMKLGKSPFNIEFSLSLGYVSATYRHYIPSIDYGELIADLYETGNVSYFGPTKVKVSLVLPLVFTNASKRGGKR